jgi:alanine racemase
MSNTKLRPKQWLLSWVEISRSALQHNIKVLRKQVGSQVILAPSVKANAYGHGMVEIAKMALKAGADWLCINALFEAEILRKAGIKAPLYIMGYVLKRDLADVIRLKCRLVVYNKETIAELGRAAEKLRQKVRIHIKMETGNNRQGVPMSEMFDFVEFTRKFPFIEIEGIATHFANIEDTTNDRYARFQLENFKRALSELASRGINIPIPHCANSAATILFPETHFAMVRPGIAVYGLWPSEEIKMIAKKRHRLISLQPVLSWKTKIAQIKEIPKGSFVGYGCTYQTKRKTRLAILPIGYYDGYDRGFSNKSHVLIHGKRAPVRGRVCMNITMVDVTDIPAADAEDTVTLLGKDGREEISAEYLGDLIGTINYEITTRIHEGIPRVVSLT